MLHHAMSNANGDYEVVESIEENAPAAVEPEPVQSEVEKTADIIMEMGAIESVKKGTFNRLVSVAMRLVDEAAQKNVASHELFEAHLVDAEESVIVQTVLIPERYAKGAKAGQIKIGAYPEKFSATYKHAKSVLINFLKNGGNLVDDDGNVKGKTAIESEKPAKAEKTPEEKLEALAVTVKALLDKCDYPNASRDVFIRAIGG